MTDTPAPQGFRIATTVIAAIVLAAVAYVMSGARPGGSTFLVSAPLPLPAVQRTDFTPQPSVEGVAHAPSAVLLADGRIALYWFAGSREAALDVGLHMSVFDGTAWSEPVRVTDTARTTADERRITYTVGNPVVFRHPDGDYWLVYVTSLGDGWSGSSLNLMRSKDGMTWGPATKLVTSPVLNLSTLVRSPPLMRADGLVALPAYYEMATNFPEMILIDPAGRVVDMVRMGSNCLIQPWLTPLGEGRAVALFRRHGCAEGETSLFTTTTGDGGASWSASLRTDIANPDSPAATFRLADGRIVALLNEDPENAFRLNLMVSADDGATWKRGAPVFDGTADGKSYRYPWLLQDTSGRLHVFASESQQAIRHAILGLDAIPSP